MTGPRFTTPQTNPPHPVFTNNIMPISAVTSITSSTLNPNAPDFTSRSGTFVPPPSFPPPRSQLAAAAFQNGHVTNPTLSSGFGPLSQIPGSLDANFTLSNFSEVMGLLQKYPPIQPAASVSGAAAASPLTSPHSSNPASPTQSAAATASVGGIAQLPEERIHAKLQPIGHGRPGQTGQKRVGQVGNNNVAGNIGAAAAAVGVAGLGNTTVGVNNELLWTMPLPDMLPAPPPLDTHNLQTNPYYSQELAQFGQVWNWNMDQQM